MALPSDGPRSPAARIGWIDALRGLALCGILLINIFQMGGPFAMDRPLSPPSAGDPDWQLWTAAQIFLTGTMRGLFSLLFGVGLLIVLADDVRPDNSGRYLRRLMILFLFGVVDSTLLLWPGDILITYALAGFVALVLHELRPARLIALAGTIMIGISIWSALDAVTITPQMTVYSPAQLERETVARLGSYWQTLLYMSEVSWTLTVGSLSYRWLGDALLMMLVGMAMYRKGLFDDAVGTSKLCRMMWIGYGAGLALRAVHVLLIFDNGGGPTVIASLLDQPGRVAMTLGHFALFRLAWRSFGAVGAKGLLAAMGRMALTLYLGQSLIGAWLFSGFGLGLWNALSWPELWAVAVAILAAQALFATLWLGAFRYGPAEWLLRWGIYERRSGGGAA